MPNIANDIVRLGILADHKVMPGIHTSESMRNENFKRYIEGEKFIKNRSMTLGIHTRIMYDFLAVIQGS